MKIYAFEWQWCIYESAMAIVSIHRTKRGAFKAMVKYANDQWLELRQMSLQCGTDNFNPLHGMRWRVKEYEIEDN